MTAARKLVIAGTILSLAVILAVSAIAIRSRFAERVPEILSEKLAPFNITVSAQTAPLLEGPACLSALQFTLDQNTTLSLKNVCIRSGLLSLFSDAPSLEISTQRLSGTILPETISNLKKNSREKTPAAAGNASKNIPAAIDIRETDIAFGEKGKRITVRSTDANVAFQNGTFQVRAHAIPDADIANAPVEFENIPPFAIDGAFRKDDKTAHISIIPDAPVEFEFEIQDKALTASVSGARLDLSGNNITAKISQVFIQRKNNPASASAKIDSVEMQASTIPSSLDDIDTIRLNTPEFSIELAHLISHGQFTTHPVFGQAIRFWQQDAGAILGDAPKHSVRKEDIVKKKKTVRKNPVSKEKLDAIRSTFDAFQAKIKAWPAIEIHDGRIDIRHKESHYDFNAVSFSTAELFKEAQKLHLAFNVRNASASFDIGYEQESPFPVIAFNIDGMDASDFLRIINMPIPEKNAGTVSFSMTASMSEREIKVGGNFSVAGFAFFHAKISPNLVRDVNASASLDATYSFDDDRLTVQPVVLTSGPVTASGQFQIADLRSDPVIQFELGSKDIPCTDIPKAIPDGFLPTITDLRLEGSTISPHISGTIPWKNPLTSSLKESGFSGRCIPTSVAPHFPETVNADDYTFTTDYTYFADSITVGPGTKSFVPLHQIPPYVKAAMYLTEDKRFFDHGPLRISFIERAVRLNLNQRSYVYGGSTIAQQLTKNLFLNRSKNLARKLEEAFIAWRLETIVSRLRIFELYINVIEFGPDIYGIRNAAQFYFGKEPQDLTPLEGAYLASLKIAPSKGGKFYKTGFAQNGYWYKRMRQILRTLAENGYISTAEVIAAYSWMPSFDYPTTPNDPRQKWLIQYNNYLVNKSRQKDGSKK